MKFEVGLKNILISYGSTAISTIAILLLTPEISKALGFEKYGLLTLYLTLIGQLSIFDFGLPKILIPRVSRGLPFIGYIIQVFALFILSLLLIYFFLLKVEYLQERVEGVYLPVVFTGAIIVFGISVARSTLEGMNKVTISVLSRNFEIVIQSFIFFIFSKSLGLNQIIAAYFSFQIIHFCILLFLIIQSEINRVISWSNKNLILSGSFLLASSIIGPYLTTFERYEFQASGHSENLGKYVLAYLVASRIFLFSSVIQPYFYNKLSRKDISLRKGVQINNSVFLLVFVAMNLIAPYFLPVWLGELYTVQILFDFRLILLGLYFNSLARLPYDYLILSDKTKWLAMMHFLEAVILFVLIYLFSWRYYELLALVIARYYIEYVVLVYMNFKSLQQPFLQLIIAPAIYWISFHTIILLICFVVLLLKFTINDRKELQNLFS